LTNKEKFRFSVRTFGCQMNVSDSQRIAGMLESNGWESCTDPLQADLVVLNTCAVRQKAEAKIYSELGRLRDEEPGGSLGRRIVAVSGCVAQLHGQSLLDRGLPIDILVGPRSLEQLPDLVSRALGGTGTEVHLALDRPGQDAFSVRARPSLSDNASRALVTVMEGCNQVCSFCVVPRTRGSEVSRPVADVLAEAASFAARGVPEVMLLGQTVNAFRWEGVDLAALLGRVGALPGVRRLRFATSHPRHLTRSLIEAFATIPALCPHLHLPVQSGSDRILTAMRRGYSSAEYLRGIEAVRDANPRVAVWSDVIVGFPGESESDFQSTLALLQAVQFDGLFVFTYSPRPGTVAAHLSDDVTPDVKSERLARVNELQQGIQKRLNDARVGGRESVLFEGVGRDGQLEGRTPQNRTIHCPGPAALVGKIRDVAVAAAGPNSLVGRLAADD
jgi:tRNA-2-methylthio-N6-dimethylallyladenosine synthase